MSCCAADDASYVLQTNQAFYEFIEEGHMDEAQPPTKLLHEVEVRARSLAFPFAQVPSSSPHALIGTISALPRYLHLPPLHPPFVLPQPGKRYELVVSNKCGLFRYRMADVLECTERPRYGAPAFRFAYRSATRDGLPSSSALHLPPPAPLAPQRVHIAAYRGYCLHPSHHKSGCHTRRSVLVHLLHPCTHKPSCVAPRRNMVLFIGKTTDNQLMASAAAYQERMARAHPGVDYSLLDFCVVEVRARAETPLPSCNRLAALARAERLWPCHKG